MGSLDYSIWIAATPDQVWRIYADPARIPDWQTGKPVIGDVAGGPGAPGSTYTSRRGRLRAGTAVLSADFPHELVTRTDAYLGLELELTSRLRERNGGTDLELHATTRWRRRLGPVAWLVERAILSPREAHKELGQLKALVESSESKV